MWSTAILPLKVLVRPRATTSGEPVEFWSMGAVKLLFRMSKPPLGLLQRLRALVLKNDLESIKGQLEGATPYDAAWAVGRFHVEERARMLSLLPAEVGARIFEELALPLQLELLRLGKLPALEAI